MGIGIFENTLEDLVRELTGICMLERAFDDAVSKAFCTNCTKNGFDVCIPISPSATLTPMVMLPFYEWKTGHLSYRGHSAKALNICLRPPRDLAKELETYSFYNYPPPPPREPLIELGTVRDIMVVSSIEASDILADTLTILFTPNVFKSHIETLLTLIKQYEKKKPTTEQGYIIGRSNYID